MASPNRLLMESSPYLQQHAHNPVDWFPWGEEAFEKARLEDKPLFISIGYSSCHWCHVMEGESFENGDVAALMNKSFVSIKVDREERPDIDSYYMNAVQMMTGKGGWPLNVFALSDGRPFFGGTYFPRENFMRLLPLVADQYDKNRAEQIRSAESIEKGTEDYRFKLLNSSEMSYDLPALKSALHGMLSSFDRTWGGIAGAPKFPMPVLYRFLLAYSHLQDDPDIRNIVLLTLDKMAGGGIYDQVGGGFARYSTDKEWKVPHFEKMLYDNAQLVSLYADAYKLTGKARYKEIVLSSIGFIEREMTSPEGVFYSALDADSQGEEGLYYTWREDELRQLLSVDYDFAARVFRIGEEGLWERGENILLMPGSEEFTDSELSRIERIAETLLKARSERVFPGLDDKSLTSWNGLMIAAYIDAYEALGEASFLEKARKAADFILENFVGPDGGLYHVYKDESAYIEGFLEDYAQLTAAMISLYEVSAEKKYLERAIGFIERSKEDFYSFDERIFYATTDGNELLDRDIELTDIILPSSNATMAHNLFRLGSLTGNSSYHDWAEVLTGRISSRVLDNPLYFSHWAELMLFQRGAFYEIVTVGPDADMLNRQLMGAYLPHTVRSYSSVPVESDMLFRGRYREDRTGIFICRDNSCGLPVSSVSEVLKQIDGRIP